MSTEADTCRKFVVPKLQAAGWDNDPHLVDFARTTAGQYNVSLGRLRAAEIPVPPLAEQRRIVAELDALQAEVDALKRCKPRPPPNWTPYCPQFWIGHSKGNCGEGYISKAKG